MRYTGQQKFLERYRSVWLLCAFLVAAALVERVTELTVKSGLLCTVSICSYLALGYLPKYLHLHREPEKRYAWSVRVRWILITTGLLLALALTRFEMATLPLIFAASAWLIFANLVVKLLYRHKPESQSLPWLYFSADLWIVAALLISGVPATVVATVAIVTIVLDVLVDASAVLGLVCVAGALAVGDFVMAAIVAVSWLLVRISSRQARRNYEETIADLSAFTGMDILATEKRLMTSRGMLVEAWQEAKLDEADREALAKWYAANSLSYLFDIARFHLTYKHITFTLDVIALSRGRCLDYGAGKGELSVELARTGRAVTYFDVPGTSRKYAEWNAARSIADLHFTSSKDEIRALVAAEGTYDTVISLDVLEHLPDLAGELEFLNSVLAPGGRIILTVPVGATQSHPMHLAHQVDSRDYLTRLGLRNAKTARMRITGSEILRKDECVIFEKSPVTASASDGSKPQR